MLNARLFPLLPVLPFDSAASADQVHGKRQRVSQNRTRDTMPKSAKVESVRADATSKQYCFRVRRCISVRVSEANWFVSCVVGSETTASRGTAEFMKYAYIQGVIQHQCEQKSGHKHW